MDEAHLYIGARYIELNPVREGFAKEPWQYRWSSAAAHIQGRDDVLLWAKPLLDMFGDWRGYLSKGETLGLDLRPQKPGPKGPRSKKEV